MFVDQLKALVTALKAADEDDPINASNDHASLNLPGVWVTLNALADPTLGGAYEPSARLVLIVPETDQLRALENLEALLIRVAAVVTPMSDVTPVSFVAKAGSTPLPALTYTHDL